MKLSHKTTNCDFCHKEASLTCGACKDSYYCGQKCQYNDFNIHKNICNIGKRLDQMTFKKRIQKSKEEKIYVVPDKYKQHRSAGIYKGIYKESTIRDRTTSSATVVGFIHIIDVALIKSCDMESPNEYDYYAELLWTEKIDKERNAPVIYNYQIYIFLNEKVGSLSNYYEENHAKIKEFVNAVVEKLGKRRVNPIGKKRLMERPSS
jgi:hypothetical protein